jgi:two-component system OmpR family sensor kinase
LAVGAVALVALVVADIVTYTQLGSFLYNRVDQDLQQSSLPYLHEQAPEGGPRPGGPSPNGVIVFAEVVSPTGEVVESIAEPFYGSVKYTPRIPSTITGFSTSPQNISVAYFTTSSGQSGGPTFRVMASELSSGNILIVAEPVEDVAATLHALEIVELIVSACALVVAALLGWWLVRQGLRPLVAMERTAESIAQGELNERVPGANDTTEVGRLARTLNVMLTRIQQAFAQRDATEAELRASEGRLRRFVADASHELRTPLAAVSAYAELFERGASDRPDDLGRVFRGIRAETSRMGKLVEDLLLLARLDEGLPLAQQPIELVTIAADSVRTAEAVGPAWPVRIEASQPVELIADGPRLRQVVDNLLANVRAHTPPGTATTVSVRTADGPDR